jgi:hypothetical protein
VALHLRLVGAYPERLDLRHQALVPEALEVPCDSQRSITRRPSSNQGMWNIAPCGRSPSLNGRSPRVGRASPSAPAASRYLSASAACFGVTTRVINFSQFTNASCSDAFS